MNRKGVASRSHCSFGDNGEDVVSMTLAVNRSESDGTRNLMDLPFCSSTGRTAFPRGEAHRASESTAQSTREPPFMVGQILQVVAENRTDLREGPAGQCETLEAAP